MEATFTVKTRYATYNNCYLSADTYASSRNIALSILSQDEGPIVSLTVNLEDSKRYPKNFNFVDTNNFPEAERIIKQLGIGKDTGRLGSSGYCIYPLYEFDVNRIKQLTEGGVIDFGDR